MATAPGAAQEQPKEIEENLRTLERVLTTDYPVAQTPKEVIWTLNKAKLYRYVPVVPAEKRHPVPLLLIFALINRSYIFDLRPGSSFVAHMLEHGYDVYLLDWGVPGPEDRNLTLDDYVLTYLPRAIRKLQKVSGSGEFSMLGWCLGAIITTLYAALRPEDGVRNLILLTAPLNFSDRGCPGFIRWVDEHYFDIDRLLQLHGNVPGELIDYGAKALKPVENYLSTYLKLWDNLDDPKVVEAWHAMNTWVRDIIPMSGGAFRQLIVNLYRENQLVEGTLTLRGERVDLRKVQASVLEVIAENDHIVPPPQSEGVVEKMGSADTEVLRVSGGHIGIMAGNGALKRTWPKIDGWLAARSGKQEAEGTGKDPTK